MKKRKKKKKALITVSVLAVAICLILYGITAFVLYSSYNTRYETSPYRAFSPEDFGDGLIMEEVFFPSNDGQMLAGYKYSRSGMDTKAVVIISHGLGSGGQSGYMEFADYFTSHGYLVFSYDATGNDNSEGESVNGFPQGTIDLSYAIDYVENDITYRGLPILLWGYSWGAYSGGCVLNVHPEVTAAILVAGPNDFMDMFENEVKNVAGAAGIILKPFARLHQIITFGEYGTFTCLDGFENSDAGVMIIHGKADTVVSYDIGYEKYYERYDSDSRFTFVSYEDKGHNDIFYTDEANEYRQYVYALYDKYLEDSGLEDNSEVKSEFMNQYELKEKGYVLDEALMKKMVDFYDSYLE